MLSANGNYQWNRGTAATAVSRPTPVTYRLFAFALVAAMLLSLLVAAPVSAQDQPLQEAPAGILTGEEAGCASFDDLALNTTFAPTTAISSGKLVLRAGQAINGNSQARVIAKPADEGNALGIIAILIGLVTGAPGASELQYSFGSSNPTSLRINGTLLTVPNLESLDGQKIAGVAIAVGDVNGDGTLELRATGPIAGFAVGGAEMWIDDVCVKAPAPLAVRTRDLGDAPDASNHWGAAMTAYPAIPARYPTVFDLAVAPVGPAHLAPAPFHLGLAVSREANADWGPDADGINNIVPPMDIKNRDRFDDGVNPALIPFANCAKPTFPVRVFIAPAAVASLPNGAGYLNLWIDANRDGDWEDAGQCPNPAGAAVGAGEHFVVDFPVNAAALGAGLHTVMVSASRPVIWPAAQAAQPAWLRATLSESPSVKLPALAYGDGRGPVPAFVTGETEDYLWRPATDPTNGPDVQVTKRGVILGRVGIVDNTLDSHFRVIWAIEYRNVGNAPATNVVLRDNAANAGVTEGSAVIRSAPVLNAVWDDTDIVHVVGTLEAGQGGRILISGRLPGDLLPPQLVNRITATAAADVDLSNNVAEATAKALLPAPRITHPGNGTTNRNQVEIRGRAYPGSEIDLYIDGAKVSTLIETDGIWFFNANLANGRHRIVAIARLGGLTSAPSNMLEILVDSTLEWNPLSLRLVGPSGLSQRPTDENGRTDAEGWRFWMKPSTPYTVSMSLCNNETIDAKFILANQAPVALTDPDDDGRFSAAIVAPATISEPLTATVNVVCAAPIVAATGDAAVATSNGSMPTAVAIPTPSPRGRGTGALLGEVKFLDARTGQPIPGATVVALPELGWYGCITCTVAASAAASAARTDAAGRVTLEDILISSAAVYDDNPYLRGEDGFVYHNITWALYAQAPGYRSTVKQITLGYTKVEWTYLMLPSLPEVGDEVIVSLFDDEWESPALTLLAGQTLRIQNLSSKNQDIEVENDETHLAPTGSQVAGAEGGSSFSTGLLLPGETVSFVLTETGALTLSSATDPTLSATFNVDQPAPSLYLPLVVK